MQLLFLSFLHSLRASNSKHKHLHISNSKGDMTMCINREELSNRVAEIRNLKAMKEELDNQLKALEFDVISFMRETEQSEYIGTDFKVTYKPQSRTTLDKKALQDILGDDLQPFEKVSTYNVLRIR